MIGITGSGVLMVMSILIIYRLIMYGITNDVKVRLERIRSRLEAELAETAMKSKAISELKDRIKLEITTADMAKIFGER